MAQESKSKRLGIRRHLGRIGRVMVYAIIGAGWKMLFAPKCLGVGVWRMASYPIGHFILL